MNLSESSSIKDLPRKRGRPPGRSPGRPPFPDRPAGVERPVDRAADAMAVEHALPKPPGNKLNWEQMQEYLALLTPAMWGHIMLYMYRIKPKIRRQLKDPNAANYIDILSEPFTLDYLIGRHGGGRYMLKAVDTDQKNSSPTRGIFDCILDIDEIAHPPILNYEELELEARENQSYITWLQNQGILDGKGNVKPPVTPQLPPSVGLSAKDVLDVLGAVNKMTNDQQNLLRSKIDPEQQALSKSIGDILVEKMRQDDPSKQIQVMSGLLSAFKEIIGTSKPDLGIAAVYDKLIQTQADQRRTDLEYIKLILESRNQPTPEQGAFATFRDMFGFARDVIESGGRGGRRNGWDIGYDWAREIGLPALHTISNTITNVMALRSGQGGMPLPPGTVAAPGPVPPGAAPRAFDPYANPAALRQYASNLTAQQPAPGPATGVPAPEAAPNMELFQLFQRYGNLIVNALNNGTAGFDFADYVTGLLGNATHAMIAAQGELAILQTMLSIPEMAIFGEARLRTFVEEFVHYQEFLSAREENEEIEADNSYQPEPPPPRPNARSAKRS